MNSYILGDAIEAIKDSVKPEIIEVNNEQYVTKQVYHPPVSRQIHAVKLHTLSGLVDYIKSNIDGVALASAAIHIVDHETVQLIDSVHQIDRTREVFAEVDCSLFTSKFQYGNFQRSENFIIDLQSQFVNNEARALILAIIGNIKEEAVKNTSDDGISQSVVAKTGVATVSNMQVPNPVKLKPFRTFGEIEQPESEFILRLQDGPRIALFASDGGKWKLEAINSIKKYFQDLNLGVPIIG